MVTTIAGNPGTAISGYTETSPYLFAFPTGLYLKSNGILYISDSVNSRIRYLDTTAGTGMNSKHFLCRYFLSFIIYFFM